MAGGTPDAQVLGLARNGAAMRRRELLPGSTVRRNTCPGIETRILNVPFNREGMYALERVLYCIVYSGRPWEGDHQRQGRRCLVPFWPQVIHSSHFPSIYRIARYEYDCLADAYDAYDAYDANDANDAHDDGAGRGGWPWACAVEFEQLDQGDPVRSPRSRDDGRPRRRRWYVLDLWVLGVDEGRGGGRCRDVLGPLAGVVWSVWRTSRGRRGVVEGTSRGCRHPHAHTHAHAHVFVRHDDLMQGTPISRRGWLP